jgi:hypothetical protein
MESSSDQKIEVDPHHGRPVNVPSVTVDALALRPSDKGPEILLITRG